MTSVHIKLLTATFLILYLVTLSSCFSSDEWSNGQLPIYNQRSNEFRFKSNLEPNRNSYGTKLLASETSNYQPIISNPITSPQRTRPKQWPDPFDPQPHVPIVPQIPSVTDPSIDPSNDFSTSKLDSHLPLKSPPDIQPINPVDRDTYYKPSEGELGSPRPKKEKMTVDDIFLGVFSPVPFNGSWLSDHELMYHDPSNNLVIHDLTNDSISLLVPNTTFVSIN